MKFNFGQVKLWLAFSFVLMAYICHAQPTEKNTDENGITTFYYPDGNISSEGKMLDGKPDGYWKNYYQNGVVKSEGNRNNHQLDSIWSFYDEEGNKTHQITYENGVRSGEYITYKDGYVYEIATFENDKKTDFSYILYPSKKIKRKIPFVDGIEDGAGFEYAEEDGRIITLLEYKEGNLRRSERINRYDSQGKKRGAWIEYYDNGVIKEEGFYMNDVKNGIFKTYDRKGNLLNVEKFREGKLVTDSEASVILDIRNSYYPNGDVKSSGGYVEGQKEGMHRIYDENGNISGGIIYSKDEKTAEGIIDESGNFQGHWKLYYDTGELKAEGDYVDSKKEGDWTYYHKNGEIEHHAKYTADLPQGQWRWYFDNGKLRREEYYRRGKEDGASIEYDIQGEVITQGEYINGLKEGEWFYHVGDHTEEGNYLDGERHGVWVYKYKDGQVSYTGEFVAGLEVGKHQWYFPNGNLQMEGKYTSGIRVGTWKTYNQEGVQILVVKYKNGQLSKINGKKVETEEEELEEDVL